MPGVGGLATAIRLASLGLQVSVFEKNPAAGGKSDKIREKGYRFDTGPSLFTLPHLVVAEISPESASGLEYRKLDTISRYFFEDQTVFTSPADPLLFTRELSRITGENQEKITKFLRDASEPLQADFSPLFLFSAFHLFPIPANGQEPGCNSRHVQVQSFPFEWHPQSENF